MSLNTELSYKFEQNNVSSSATLGTITDIVSLMEDNQTVCLDGFFYSHYSTAPEFFWNNCFTRIQFEIKKTSSGLEITSEHTIYFIGGFESGASINFSAAVSGTSNENIDISCNVVAIDADVFARLKLIYVNV